MKSYPGRKAARLYRVIRRQAARIARLKREIRKLKREMLLWKRNGKNTPRV